LTSSSDFRAQGVPVDVAEFIDATRFGRVHAMVTALCAFVALLDGYDTLAIAYAAPAIAEQWAMDASLFGPIFAAHGVGGTIGGVLIGAFADRKGRRVALCTATVLFGLGALATALATSFTQLLICRLLIGAGLAGALVNAISLVAEYSPLRFRTSVVSAMFSAFPLGGALGGAVSAQMIQAWGWPSLFWVGGAFPIALACLLAILLPESVKFLVVARSGPRRIALVLNRLAGRRAFRGNETFTVTREAQAPRSVRSIFAAHHALNTVLLWIAFAINQVALTFAITWMPLTLHRAGIPLGRAAMASTLYTLAGIVGAITFARLADRVKSAWPVGWAYLLSALALGAIGWMASTMWLLFAIVSVAGFFMVGVAVNLNPIAASVYPTAIRSTGVGWSLALKSVGGIAGALAGSALVSSNLSVALLYSIAAIPVVVGAASLGLLVKRTTASGPRFADLRIAMPPGGLQ